MAEDTREIVYYKGIQYHIIEELESGLTRLQEVSKPTVTKLVETQYVLSEEQYQVVLKNRRSTHQMWIH